MRCTCGAEVISALTPSGRCIELDVDHVWVTTEQPWPRRIFLLGVAGGPKAPVVPAATPVIELVDATTHPNGRSGPFRREHACARPA